MDIVIILQIITITVSVVSMILGVVNVISENNKNRYLEIVTNNRVENKKKVQGAAKIILTATQEVLLSEADLSTLKEAAGALSEMTVVLKDIYPQENKLLKIGDRLLADYKMFVENKNSVEYRNRVLQSREDFYTEFSIYDLADWQFIKNQFSGKKANAQDFDNIYEEIQGKYKNKKG